MKTTIAWEGHSCEGVDIILRIGAWEKPFCEGDTISTIGGYNFINGGGVEKLNYIGGKLGEQIVNHEMVDLIGIQSLTMTWIQSFIVGFCPYILHSYFSSSPSFVLQIEVVVVCKIIFI